MVAVCCLVPFLVVPGYCCLLALVMLLVVAAACCCLWMLCVGGIPCLPLVGARCCVVATVVRRCVIVGICWSNCRVPILVLISFIYLFFLFFSLSPRGVVVR